MQNIRVQIEMREEKLDANENPFFYKYEGNVEEFKETYKDPVEDMGAVEEAPLKRTVQFDLI